MIEVDSGSMDIVLLRFAPYITVRSCRSLRSRELAAPTFFHAVGGKEINFFPTVKKLVNVRY